MSWSRGAGVASSLVVGAAVLLLAAPNATASTWGDVTLEKSNPQAGCSYKVTSGDLVGGGSSSVNGAKVTFFDDGAVIGSGTVGGGLLGNPAKVTWTPKTAGQHVLTASSEYLGGGSGFELTPLTVQVRESSSTGSFGCPLPSISG
ncbi:hypothetical protein [Nocardia jejuensis]|uniref:hypothetical protein n=1 Tax=Nocardia jejuensis TaxID=328049 RepID=UPI0012F867B1|nr:hypothetical protein [Nocardia jejuensis]